MYRLYGVPARYVSGYSVSPSDFKENSDGTYSATITDQKAHAWTEILLDDYGWSPVEFTPSESGAINASYPGFNIAKAEDHLSKKNWKISLNDTTKRKINLSFFDIRPNRDFFINLFKLIVALIIIVLVLIKIIRICSKRKMDVRKIYTLISNLYHQRLPDATGNESNFEEQLGSAYPELSKDEINQMIQLVNKVTFSSYSENQADQDFMWQFYEHLYQITIHKVKFPLKLWLMYNHL